MTTPPVPAHVWESVLPVCDGRGSMIGTGVVVAPRQVLTALHVVHPEPAPLIADRLAVTAIISLRPWQFGATRRLAQSSYQRTVILSGADDGTVDLALLAVPELRAPSLPTRRTPVRTGELVTVPGYPGGWRTASHGPITSADEADFGAHVSLGAGISGAPAIDRHGRLAGLITMDHATAGAIAIGPAILSAFADRAPMQLRARDLNPRR